MNFRIAVLQSRSEPHNIEKNIVTVVAFMKASAEKKADILLLPECFLTGYALPISNHEALCDNSLYVKRICAEAKKYKIGVVATALTKGVEKPRNTAFVIGKEGNILMKYSKVHTCDFSYEACLESGDVFKVCDFDGVKLGIMICYDREYPESARILMLKGAEIILVPNDCRSMKPRVRALSTRAYENMVGVVMANPYGENAGCSCAFSPRCWDNEGICIDNTIFLADEMTDGLFFADFNIESLRSYRENEMMGNTFRKVHAYEELLHSEVKAPFIR